MNDQLILTDAALEAMLARRAGPAAPTGLAESIGAALAALPGDRRPWWSVFAPPADRSPALRMAWVVAVVGLLLAATVSAVLVGSELVRRTSQLTVVPPPTVVPAPSAAPASSAAPAPTSAPAAVATRPVEQVNDLAFAADGSLWLATGGGVIHWDTEDGSATLYGQNDGLPTTGAGRVAVASDGSTWASGAAWAPWVARFDGSWTAHTASGDLGKVGVIDLGGIAVDADGTLWVAGSTNEGPRLLRFDGSWMTVEVPESIAGNAFPWAGRLEVAPDGTIWALAHGPSPVASFDGAAWTAWSKEATGLPRTPALAGIAPDGGAWVELEAEGCAMTEAGAVTCRTSAAGVARFDGSRWTIFSTASGLVDDDASILVGLDGTVWATYPAAPTSVSRLVDGGWVTTNVPALADTRAIGAAPDGALWLTSPDGLIRYDGATATPFPWPAVETSAALPPLALEPFGEPTVTESALGTITWQVYEEAPEHDLSSLVGTAHGPVVLDGLGVERDLRWLGPAGTWEGTALPVQVWDFGTVGDGLVIGGPGSHRQLTWDGSRWVVGDVIEGSPYLEDAGQFASGPHGVIVFGETYGVAVAHDGRHFVAPAVPPGGGETIGSVLATADGFVALVSANSSSGRGRNRFFDLIPWFSADGLTWEQVAATSPFGTGTEIAGVAGRDGRFVAVSVMGDSDDVVPRWKVWVSDDGRAWERLPDLERPELCTSIEEFATCFDPRAEVTAGTAGWIIYTWDGAAWASADGRTWEPLRSWPGVRGGGWYGPPGVALGGDTIVALGSLPGPWKGVVVVGTIEP